LRNAIVQIAPGFEPGQRISVAEVAAQYGVSATPVKEALKRLEAVGLVEIKPRRGIYVTRLSSRDVEEICALRAALEQAAIRMCDGDLGADIVANLERTLVECEQSVAVGDVERYRDGDLRFHRLFVEASGNQRLVTAYDTVLSQVQSVQLSAPRSPDHIEVSLREHRDLLETARNGDLNRLEAEIGAHWQRSTKRVLAWYHQYLAGTLAERPRSDAGPLSAQSAATGVDG
jgi:DNA-binding GntR family transcriptional regulator